MVIKNWPFCVFFQLELIEAVREISTRCDCALLSGGVDTSFVVSLHRKPQELTAFTVDFGVGDHRDVGYAKYLVRKQKIGKHVIITPDLKEFQEAIDWVLKNLRTVDVVEVVSDAVHYISLNRAKRYGCKSVLTGDGGDELFLGYSFLLDKSDEELRAWIKKMVKEAWLPTVWIGQKLGIEVVAPLYSDVAKKVALNTPIYCFIDRDNSLGKYLLRNHLEVFELYKIAKRPKVPVTQGSGAITAFRKLVRNSGRAELLKGLKKFLGFRPKSKLQAYLGHRMMELGIEPPPVCSDEGRRCPVCGRCMKENRCWFCGAYISDKGEIVRPY